MNKDEITQEESDRIDKQIQERYVEEKIFIPRPTNDKSCWKTVRNEFMKYMFGHK